MISCQMNGKNLRFQNARVALKLFGSNNMLHSMFTTLSVKYFDSNALLTEVMQIIQSMNKLSVKAMHCVRIIGNIRMIYP